MASDPVARLLAMNPDTNESLWPVLVEFCKAQKINLVVNYKSETHQKVSAWICMLKFFHCDSHDQVGREFRDFDIHWSMTDARETALKELLIALQQLLSPTYVKPAQLPRYHEFVPRELLKHSRFVNGDLEMGSFVQYIALSSKKTPQEITMQTVHQSWEANAGLKERCQGYAGMLNNYFFNETNPQTSPPLFLQNLESHIESERARNMSTVYQSNGLFDTPNDQSRDLPQLPIKQVRLSRILSKGAKTTDFILLDQEKTATALDIANYLVLQKGCSSSHADVAAVSFLTLYRDLSSGIVSEHSDQRNTPSLEEEFVTRALSMTDCAPRNEGFTEDVVRDILRGVFGYCNGTLVGAGNASARQINVELETSTPESIIHELEGSVIHLTHETVAGEVRPAMVTESNSFASSEKAAPSTANESSAFALDSSSISCQASDSAAENDVPQAQAQALSTTNAEGEANHNRDVQSSSLPTTMTTQPATPSLKKSSEELGNTDEGGPKAKKVRYHSPGHPDAYSGLDQLRGTALANSRLQTPVAQTTDTDNQNNDELNDETNTEGYDNSIAMKDVP